MITKLPPLEHQQQAYDQFIEQGYGALFCEMGTGKTKIILDIIQNSTPSATLVAAPNGLHLNWEYAECPKHLSIEHITYCWKGKPTSKKAKAELQSFMAADVPYKFFLINVEALRTKTGFEPAEAFLKAHNTTNFIIDESTCIKNPKAIQTKNCLKLAKLSDRRWILNGTPITQGPLDLFSQCKFLSKDAIPYSSYTAFKAQFAIETVMTMQNRSFKKITGYRQLDRLTDEIRPFSLMLKKKDCLDLPEKTFTTEVIDLTTEQQRVYTDIKDLCMTQLASGEIVSTTIALTKLVKLHQILTGFVIDDEGNVTDLPNNRLSRLLQIAETKKPLVVFCAYRHNILQVTKALAQAFGDKKVVSYYGDTTRTERTNAVQRFQDGEADFFVGTSAAAKGLTLHRADTMVYFSNTYSLETRLQSQDRIHRIGQKNECTYIDLVTPNSIDQMILGALHNKKDLASTVLDDLVEVLKS